MPRPPLLVPVSHLAEFMHVEHQIQAARSGDSPEHLPVCIVGRQTRTPLPDTTSDISGVANVCDESRKQLHITRRIERPLGNWWHHSVVSSINRRRATVGHEQVL